MSDREQVTVEKDVTVSMLAANVLGTVFGLAPGLLLLAFFWMLWRGRDVTAPPALGWLGVLAIFVAGIVVHELLHGLGWMVFAGVPRSAVRFGVKWKVLTPYAHSAAHMPVRGYRWGVFLPGLILGIMPGVLAIVTGSLLLLGFGFFFTLTAGGDFLVLWLLRAVPAAAHVRDHPTKVGAIVTL